MEGSYNKVNHSLGVCKGLKSENGTACEKCLKMEGFCENSLKMEEFCKKLKFHENGRTGFHVKSL